MEKDTTFFKREWYERHFPDSKFYSKGSYYHYIEVGWKKGYDPGPDFSTCEYLKKYKDVQESGICPLLHYIEDGKQENRETSKSIYYYEDSLKEIGLYNEEYYKSQIKETNIENYFVHYVNIGWKKLLDPSEDFSTKLYLQNNPDLKNKICPLIHYYVFGRKEGRKIYKTDQQLEGNYLHRDEMLISRIVGRKNNKKIIDENKQNKFLVILHIYYLEAWKEIKEYLNNLSCYDFDLYVTFIKNPHWETVKKAISDFKWDTIFVEVSNNGFDILPYIKVLELVDLSKYKAVFKIHTKGTFNRAGMIGNYFYKDRDWFLNLFDAILGPDNVHKTISLITNSYNKVGMVGADNLIIEDPDYQKNYVIAHLKNIGLNVNDEYAYIAGTCFCLKSEIAQQFKEKKISQKIFSDSDNTCLSLAHAFERYLGIFVNECGYFIKGIKVDAIMRKRWHELEYFLNKMAAMNIINNKICILSSDSISANIENHFIYGYRIKKVQLKELVVVLDGEAYLIEDLPPYKYLIDKEKNKKLYIDFCRKYRRKDFFGVTNKEFLNFDGDIFLKRYNNLITHINAINYNYQNCYILVNKKDNSILDGLHRASILLYDNSNELIINVLELDYVHYDLNSAKYYSTELVNLDTGGIVDLEDEWEKGGNKW